MAARPARAGRAEDAADELRQALALWRGSALADLPEESRRAAEADRLDELRLTALELRYDVELASGRHDAVVAELEALTAEHPYHERFLEQRVLALYRCGRQADALEVYREARRTLSEDLGLEPSPALQELERAVLRQDASLAAPPAPTRSTRPLRSPPTPLVGRRLELAAVAALFRNEAVRLVTLTGPGGTGKTRLGLAVAEVLEPELRDGAIFVSLAPVSSPELLVPTIRRRTRGTRRRPPPRRGRRRAPERAPDLARPRQLRAAAPGSSGRRRPACRRAAIARSGHEPRPAETRRRARVPGAAVRHARCRPPVRGARQDRRAASSKATRPVRRTWRGSPTGC